MSSVIVPEALVGAEPIPSPVAKPRERLLALDIFRGMTLIAMVLVNMPGDERFTYAAISHVRWDGWSIADLIFPFFIFIVGVAVPYSFGKRLARGDSNGKLFAHIVVRAAVLFGVGLFMTWYYNYMGGFTRYHLSNIRLFGALERIGLCYPLAAPLYLKVKPRGLAIISATILVLYFILLKFVPVPGFGVPTLAKVGNWVAYVDLHITPHHLGMGNNIWEPKGWLGTFPAVANMLIGVLAGLFLRSPRSPMEKVRTFLVVGNIGILLGLIWSIWIPINQNLWTNSMVVFMCGMALAILGCSYYVADVRKITWWTMPFSVVGVNSLFLWVMAGTTDSVFNLELIKVHLADGTRAPLLFEDEKRREERPRRDPILPTEPSASAQAKKSSHQTPDGLPVHSFQTLLAELASRAQVTCEIKAGDLNVTRQQVPEPTPLQARTYELIRRFPVTGN